MSLICLALRYQSSRVLLISANNSARLAESRWIRFFYKVRSPYEKIGDSSRSFAPSCGRVLGRTTRHRR